MKRRRFLKNTTTGVLALSLIPVLPAFTASKKFKMSLKPGAIGVKVTQKEMLALARRYGFEAIEPYAADLAAMSEDQLEAFLDEMKESKISWGIAGLPIQFRQDEARFREDLEKLPASAKILQKAGVEGMSTWIMPGNNERPYLENYKLHIRRLQAVANILGHYNMKLGLEYVGPKTLMTRYQYAFIRCMREARELISGIGENNVGLVLDSFHWFCAGETAADILSLDRKDVVTCDLNDAYAGRSADEQIDNQRELPMATGVIDLKAFLEALVQIGYDGPIRAEPFNKKLNEMDNEAAMKATAEAMKKAFALV